MSQQPLSKNAKKVYKGMKGPSLMWEGPPGTFRTPGLGPDKRYKNSKPKKKTSSRGGSTSSANNEAKRNMGHAKNRRKI